MVETLGKTYWIIRWHSVNQLDGARRHVMFEDCKPLLFHTRREARAYRDQRYGYIRHRPDLRAEPHGWRLPQVIAATVEFKFSES